MSAVVFSSQINNHREASTLVSSAQQTWRGHQVMTADPSYAQKQDVQAGGGMGMDIDMKGIFIFLGIVAAVGACAIAFFAAFLAGASAAAAALLVAKMAGGIAGAVILAVGLNTIFGCCN